MMKDAGHSTRVFPYANRQKYNLCYNGSFCGHYQHHGAAEHLPGAGLLNMALANSQLTSKSIGLDNIASYSTNESGKHMAIHW